jgi:hypothetical protein
MGSDQKQVTDRERLRPKKVLTYALRGSIPVLKIGF